VSDSDPELDLLLRDVPLPDGFAERLQAALLPSDERLDAALAAFPVPSVVLARLREIPGDVAVDEAVNDVASPPALIYSLRRPTWSGRLQRVGRQLQRLAIAALWFVALSATLAAGLRAIVSGTLSRGGDQSEIVFIYDGPLSLALVQPNRETVNLRLADTIESSELLPALDEPADTTPPIARVDLPNVDGPPPAGPVAQWVSLVSSGLRPLDDAVLLRYGILGSPHYADDHLPDLVAPRQPRGTGIEPPPVRGYDRVFFLKNRLFPPLVPAAHPRLMDLDVPLVTGNDALAWIERPLAEGRAPQPQDVRVEDLIAAMDYRFDAAPAGSLALELAAGPAIFGPPESGLLLVGVQAGGLARHAQAATHLVIALDLSHSMTRGGRLHIVQQALGRLLDQLGPRDRLSLVIFNEEVTHVVESASLGDAPSLRELVAGLAPRGGTNLAAGLQQAASLAMSDAAGRGAARRLVLVTDSQATMPAETRSAIELVLTEAGATGVRLDVVDLSQRPVSDSILQAWAAELQGDLRQVHDLQQMTRLLLGALAGADATIARDARLKLHFHPDAVAAYRLVGHEANSLAGLTPVALEADLAAGEAAAALIEIWAIPGTASELGYAELTWRDPASGTGHRVRQPITRQQFTSSPGQPPLALIQAAMAAEVGESLRESHAALRQAGLRSAGPRGLSAVLEVAERAPSPLHRRPDVERLLKIVRDLKREGVR
jgi:Ca-activated chloride channel family protein